MSQDKSEKNMDKFYKSYGKEGYEHMSNKVFGLMRVISGPLAVNMLKQVGLDQSTDAPFSLLDTGAGTGIVSDRLQEMVSPDILAQSKIVSGDSAERMVEIVKRRAAEEGWVNTESRIVDSQDIHEADATFTHVTGNIVFHVVPDSEKALKECIRVLKPGGMLGLTTWHKSGSGWIDDVKGAFESFPFEAPFVPRMQTTRWGEWPDVNWVKKALTEQGLEDVTVGVHSHLQAVESAAEFVSQFASMVEWMVKTDWSDQTQEEHSLDEVKKLLEEYLVEKHGGKGWYLTWTSITASGRKPL